MVLALPIESGRVVVRRLALSDLERFAACRADAQLARYQGWSPMNRDAARAFIVEMIEQRGLELGKWTQLAVADRADDRLLGDIGLCVNDQGDAEVGFTFLQDAQGKGFATEALRALFAELSKLPEVVRIVGVTDERNGASIKVLERLGMRMTARQEAVFKQEMCVELRYELGAAKPGT